MKLVIILLLLAPCPLLLAQISYQDGLDKCKRIGEEQTNDNQGSIAYVPPDCMIGAKAPEFSFITLDGQEFTNQNVKGKITVINFWLISCPPCIAEIPGLNNIVEKYGRENFNYIAIGMDEVKDIKEFLINHPWRFDQVASDRSIIIDIFNMRWGFPTTFVLNREAVIIGAFSGGKRGKAAKAIEVTV